MEIAEFALPSPAPPYPSYNDHGRGRRDSTRVRTMISRREGREELNKIRPPFERYLFYFLFISASPIRRVTWRSTTLPPGFSHALVWVFFIYLTLYIRPLSRTEAMCNLDIPVPLAQGLSALDSPSRPPHPFLPPSLLTFKISVG